jgi:uncharacterized lipoprotein YmbA
MKFFAVPAVIVLLALAACSSPNPVLYTINTVPGAAVSGTHRVIVVREVGIAHYLDRSQIVRFNANNKLTVASNDWWGEPLAGMITRVLVEELSQRLPDDTVTGDNSAVGASPDLTVEFEVQHLDGDGPAAVTLAGQIGIDPTNGRPSARNVSVTVPQATPDAQGYAAASSAALGQVADLVVRIIGK